MNHKGNIKFPNPLLLLEAHQIRKERDLLKGGLDEPLPTVTARLKIENACAHCSNVNNTTQNWKRRGIHSILSLSSRSSFWTLSTCRAHRFFLSLSLSWPFQNAVPSLLNICSSTTSFSIRWEWVRDAPLQILKHVCSWKLNENAEKRVTDKSFFAFLGERAGEGGVYCKRW